VEAEMSNLADEMSVILENVAPKAFNNLTAFSQVCNLPKFLIVLKHNKICLLHRNLKVVGSVTGRTSKDPFLE